MAVIYVDLIELGIREFHKIAECMKEEVAKLLIEKGEEDLIDEEKYKPQA